ncbi:MAG TPA: ComEC/Rec2 family competence protein [Acidimicrobiales bacterium]|nr:ComEC/Rec2 family competence protein [Acidimicrobiales bacterium]
MSQRRFLPALALLTALGAWVAHPVPLSVAAALALVASRLRHPWLWCAVAAVAASSLAARSWDGLQAAVPAEVAGVATVVTDPDDRHGAVHAELRVGGRHYDTWARGAAAGSLHRALAGEVLEVRGTPSPLRGRIAPHLRRRHIVARLQLEAAGPPWTGAPLSRLANGLRRTIERGATAMPERERGLFAGFVLGDDRGQNDETVERFRDAGLSHLLVVSGQNVAFALLLAAPLVARGANGARLAATAVVLVFFGTVVRWEPSVVRAIVMAGLGVSARTFARPADRLQLVAGAVVVILLVDPLLVGSVSFLLSVSASVGLAVVAPWVAERLRGPRPLVDVLSATVGAQVGVAPTLLVVFGSIPLASVPANLLAVPVAGPLMMWGMVAGIPAGVLGGRLATLLHRPTGLMLTWIDGVARWGSGLDLPALGPRAALLGAGAAAMAAVSRRLVSRREAATRRPVLRPHP